MVWEQSESKFRDNQVPIIGMRPMKDVWLIHVDITNACLNECAHCTRAVRHVATPFYIDPATVEQYVIQMRDFPRGIGIMGGEPTIHPDFPDICRRLNEVDHKGGYALFTAVDPKTSRFRSLIERTFNKVHYTDHTLVNRHHPVLLSANEIVPDPILRKELLDRCWLQHEWSATMTPKGGFFCEIAGVLDMLFDGPGGFPIVPHWWDRTDIQEQVDRWCGLCGMSLPLGHDTTDKDLRDHVTPLMYKRLLEIQSPYADQGHCIIHHYTFDKTEIEKRKNLFEGKSLSILTDRQR